MSPPPLQHDPLSLTVVAPSAPVLGSLSQQGLLSAYSPLSLPLMQTQDHTLLSPWVTAMCFSAILGPYFRTPVLAPGLPGAPSFGWLMHGNPTSHKLILCSDLTGSCRVLQLSSHLLPMPHPLFP
jgi:hypothetical protein